MINAANLPGFIPAPLRRDTLPSKSCATLPIMYAIKPYLRTLYRLPVVFPAMYCVVSTVGEGTISNLTALGCSIETDEPLSPDHSIALRLLLPDQQGSLPIEVAHVRWVNGNRAGVEFTQVDRVANLRLHSFVWDRMVERIHTMQQQKTAAYSTSANAHLVD
jgi:hypothetical protein